MAGLELAVGRSVRVAMKPKFSSNNILDNYYESLNKAQQTNSPKHRVQSKNNYNIPTDGNLSLSNIREKDNKTMSRKTFNFDFSHKNNITAESPEHYINKMVTASKKRYSTQSLQFLAKDSPSERKNSLNNSLLFDSGVKNSDNVDTVSVGFTGGNYSVCEFPSKRKSTLPEMVESNLLQSCFSNFKANRKISFEPNTGKRVRKTLTQKMSVDFLSKNRTVISLDSIKSSLEVPTVRKELFAVRKKKKLEDSGDRKRSGFSQEKRKKEFPKEVEQFEKQPEKEESKINTSSSVLDESEEIIELKVPEEHKNIRFFNTEESTQGNFYEKILNKYLFGNYPSANDKVAKTQLNNDINLLKIQKEEDDKIEKLLEKEKMLVNDELSEFSNYKEKKLSRVSSRKSIEINNLKEKFLSERSRKSSASVSSRQQNNRVVSDKEKHMKRKEEAELKEIKSLIGKLIRIEETKEELLAKISNDYLKDDISKMFENVKLEKEISNNYDFETNDELNRSLVIELENMKESEFDDVSEKVPLKYNLENSKVVKEEKKIGKVMRMYENGVIEFDFGNVISREFPDGYKQMQFKNKDFRQTFPNGNIISYFAKSKTIECAHKEWNFKLYKYSGGQIEKHFVSGVKYIKFSNGSFKIIRPNGEEANMEESGKISLKQKNGLIKTFFKK